MRSEQYGARGSERAAIASFLRASARYLGVETSAADVLLGRFCRAGAERCAGQPGLGGFLSARKDLGSDRHSVRAALASTRRTSVPKGVECPSSAFL
jgi:hypothetical protein